MLATFLETLETPEEKIRFEKIYYQHVQRLYAISWKILKNKEDAEDMVHDTFQAVIENMDKVQTMTESQLGSYITTIVKNRSLTLYSRRKKHQSVAVEEENIMDFLSFDNSELETDLSGRIVKDECHNILAELIMELPNRCRSVLYLYYYNDLPYAEIGKVLQMTEANARQIAARARKILSEKMKERGMFCE